MLRTLFLTLLALGLAAALAAVARHLYLQDAKGVRTAVAKRYPASYERQDLTGRELQGGFLPYANFRHTKLYETILSDANLQFADFSGADFEMAGLSGTDFSHAVFREAKLDRARWLESAIFRHASFRGTDLSGVSFHGLYGAHRRSKAAHLLDPGAGGADLTGAVFDGADCHRAIFSRCLLAGASFKGSDCREANFTNADLRDADFTDADLRGAKLEGADISGAIFTNARRR